ncbi:MAG: protein kinase domain-containing protein, partial [Oligoflexus sp.]
MGTNIADRYCITGEIGGGGMGRVYSAIPFTDPSQTVAIKVIERTRLDHEDVFRFQREAALMSRLRHPNIIAFHELG